MGCVQKSRVLAICDDLDCPTGFPTPPYYPCHSLPIVPCSKEISELAFGDTSFMHCCREAQSIADDRHVLTRHTPLDDPCYALTVCPCFGRRRDLLLAIRDIFALSPHGRQHQE